MMIRSQGLCADCSLHRQQFFQRGDQVLADHGVVFHQEAAQRPLRAGHCLPRRLLLLARRRLVEDGIEGRHGGVLPWWAVRWSSGRQPSG
jgi:hypothetical protein